MQPRPSIDTRFAVSRQNERSARDCRSDPPPPQTLQAWLAYKRAHLLIEPSVLYALTGACGMFRRGSADPGVLDDELDGHLDYCGCTVLWSCACLTCPWHPRDHDGTRAVVVRLGCGHSCLPPAAAAGALRVAA